MAGEIVTTVVGNLTGDPELRFTPSGAAVANFRVACTPRRLDKDSNEWTDGDTTFLRVTVWREAGEHCAQSLRSGDRVMVTGRLANRPYETTDESGATVKRTALEIDASEVAASLRYRDVRIVRPARQSDVEHESDRAAPRQPAAAAA